MIFRALVGLLAPTRLSCALFLRAELRQLRPGQPDLPSAAIDEFVDLAIGVGEMHNLSGVALKSHAVSMLEHTARDIAGTLAGRPSALPAEMDYVKKILRKHGAA